MQSHCQGKTFALELRGYFLSICPRPGLSCLSGFLERESTSLNAGCVLFTWFRYFRRSFACLLFFSQKDVFFRLKFWYIMVLMPEFRVAGFVSSRIPSLARGLYCFPQFKQVWISLHLFLSHDSFMITFALFQDQGPVLWMFHGLWSKHTSAESRQFSCINQKITS